MSGAGAIVLSLLVPGAAHVRLGRAPLGILAFVCCLGLFLAGYAILGERWYHYALFPPMDALAPVLRLVPIHHLPDALNVPGAVVAGIMDPGSDFISQRIVRTALDSTMMENAGRFLTGASGMASAFFASDAFYRARQAARDSGADGVVAAAHAARGLPSPGLVAGLSWLVPGLGHSMVGQKGKGMLMGAGVISLFVGGVLVSRGQAVDCVMADVWWIGQNGFGGGTLLAGALGAPMTMGGEFAEGWELGVNLTTVAGLANLALMLDAWSLAAGDVHAATEEDGAVAPGLAPVGTSAGTAAGNSGGSTSGEGS